MDRLSALYDIAANDGITLECFPLSCCQSMSVQEDGKCFIGIDPYQLHSTPDEIVKLAHELGHCETLSFYNRWSPADDIGRHENRADRWAIQRLIPEEELDAAVESGLTEAWELAEHFQVTEPFLRRAVAYYRIQKMI